MSPGEKTSTITKKTEVDLAYAILKDKKEPVHYRPLIEQVLEQKGKPEEGLERVIAAILTQINLDNRFFHHGGGFWGLREWAPKQKAQRVPLISPLHKRQRETPEDSEEEEENELERGFIINDFEYTETEEEDYEE